MAAPERPRPAPATTDRRDPRRTVWLPAAALAVLALAAPAGALELALTPEQEEAAIALGRASVTAETFGGEWQVDGGGGARLTVYSAFHRLALAGRHAALRGQPLKSGDRKRALDGTGDRLIVWVTLRGAAADFARHYTARLEAGGGPVAAVFSQNERTARADADGRFTARSVYEFPVATLSQDTRARVVVADADGREVASFALDFARMR